MTDCVGRKIHDTIGITNPEGKKMMKERKGRKKNVKKGKETHATFPKYKSLSFFPGVLFFFSRPIGLVVMAASHCNHPQGNGE